ncbi:DISARM system helicase DrmA [Nitrobacter vulgaris]|uniref:Helicase C-terminal domain-containing protein n=1 Tax=Nitrobacter vulgaris TaxID=29421 RepID=A0A1V4HZ29_NITVU|nr:DISARM system helicase DrmA [Nitrobacter vulgaris]OPH83129.1 hypothetical protein B2M20_09130 [Nitrobacter vulgaris]
MTSSVEIRSKLVDLLRRDLIGPHPDLDHDLAHEVLPEKPSRWYVGGFIVPAYDGVVPAVADEDEVVEETGDDLLAGETLDSAVDGDADEKDSSDQPPRDRFLPSSIGLTVMLPETVNQITMRATWGNYKTEPPLPDALLIPELSETGKPKPEKPDALRWVRIPGEARKVLDVTRNQSGIPLPESAAPQRPGGGLEISVHQRVLQQNTPEGTEERLRVVTVFLVNRRRSAKAPYKDVAYAFQCRIELECDEGFYPRGDLSTYQSDDPDLRLADLHYRDVCEYGVGRNTSAGWEGSEDRSNGDAPMTRVWTEFLPQQEVERVVPTRIDGVQFGMEALAAAAMSGPAALGAALDALPDLYAEWRRDQEHLMTGLAPRRLQTVQALFANADAANRRIRAGISLLKLNSQAREAFGLMNAAMAMANRQREAAIQKRAPDELDPPTWRPFQLAFVLLNLAGMTDRNNPERDIVDLLFFPTGGGKTEAYLGLAAYAIVLRRLRGSGVLGAGVSVIMRYTLRLLTLDQLSRAAGLVCALELLRTKNENGRKSLGDWPIEIGLWVGGAASPNNLKPRNPSDKDAATTWLKRYQRRPKTKSPVPLKACPWCGTPFKPESFHFTPNSTAPQNLAIKCENAECDFTRDRALPIIVVDEPIYRRLPAFLIATVDKFASLPWIGQSGAFFGHVDRYEPERGFFGASEPGQGRPLGNGHHLDPPDLIIQDELHLISGPLGTVAGLYEMAIDLLASRSGTHRSVRPKIVASTATVRRAERQIAALFDRSETAVFPPPGISRANSFFAKTVPSSEEPARLYIGVASQGRGPKLLFLRSMQTLLSGSQALTAPQPADENPADPYLTVLAYFNALRELGGARRIVEDEIREHVANYGDKRQRVAPAGMAFANRQMRQPLELTSRVTTDEVALAKDRLGRALMKGGFVDDDSVDVALATNMISVGLDISRLGLMLVQGQPKTTAEYIQATSRVGRASGKPGLVVTILNLHKPRDRAHYEQFRAFHSSFYRAVEATSVTPFAPRALDRALAAVVVAAARHHDPALSPSDAVSRLKDYSGARDTVITALRRRALSARVDRDSIDRAVSRAVELFDMWEQVAETQTATGGTFTYDGSGVERRLLQYPLDRASETLDRAHQQFVAARSMRDVEYAVFLKSCDPFGQPLHESEHDQ